MDLNIYDIVENKIILFQSFPIDRPLPVNISWFPQTNGIVFSTLDAAFFHPSTGTNSRTSVSYIYSVGPQQPPTKMMPVNDGDDIYFEAVLNDGTFFVSSWLSNDDQNAYERKIIDEDGDTTRTLDINQAVEKIIGRSISTSTLTYDKLTSGHEFPAYPKANGNFVYFKKCGNSNKFYTCYLIQLDVDTSEVREVLSSPGESIMSINVSPDNAIVLLTQCKYINLDGLQNNCTLRGYDIKSGQSLFEIASGSNPVWSPDGQYFLYIAEIVQNNFLQNSTLMRAKRDGSEITGMLPGKQRIAQPDWSK